MAILYALLGALTFRVRGGLRIPFTDRKFPLCKWWFATFIMALAYILKGADLKVLITAFIAGKMCTSISGWGTYIGALLAGTISETDKDDLNITDFVQNTVFAKFLKKDYRQHPHLYGFITLSLRGGLTTYLLGLAFNSPLFMITGLLQGSVYWLGGWICRNVYNDGKCGWKISEWLWGFVLGLFLYLLA